ncbi:hypothetical protein PINS_up002837 [Pythium insidiosum]|nr:hypothetical protein PINS_up002837 [Pythium insidiosum]
MAGLRKEVLLVQNLQLLGFRVDDDAKAPTRPLSASVRSHTSTAVTLHPSMFDRPNEKVLFQLLRFLLLKLDPSNEQELRFCWPIVTPHDKSNFKRVVQSILQELEKNSVLPVGSSQASRLNTGYGPRIVDLMWRLSTHVMKTSISRDFPAYAGVPPPARGASDNREAINLLKARIAARTRCFKEQCVTRTKVQDQWIAFAATLTRQIQETNARLEQIYEEQSRLDASVDRQIYSQVAEVQRSTKLKNVATAWQTIECTLGSDVHEHNQQVLSTARQYHGDQPVMDARSLRPEHPFSDRTGALNLVDMVKNAEALVQLTRRHIAQADAVSMLTESDVTRMQLLTRDSNSHVAMLTSMVQQLRQLLGDVKASNDAAIREQYIAMASVGASENGPSSKNKTLCPPTPADQRLQESDLVRSLRKCSMNEFTSIAAQSVRDSAKKAKKKRLSLPPSSAADEQAPNGDHVSDDAISRRLDYGLDEENHEDQMEL